MFARYPEPGTTKTRLASTIGDRAAADLYGCFVEDLVQRVCGLADQLWIAITPHTEQSCKWIQSLADSNSKSEVKLLAQPSGTLGDRIAWFFRQAAAQGGGPAVLIGTDNPDLPSARITQALETLSSGSADLVTVPAADGGYVLIGLSSDPQTLFDGIRWSSPFTLLDTIGAATTAGLRLEVLSGWYDVDHIENLGTLTALQKQPGLTEAAPCPRTAEYLEGLLPRIAGGCGG
jgi:rSAM/selenodomain-associated transferase 1